MYTPDLDSDESSKYYVDISPSTGLSSDYYNEFWAFVLWYSMMNQHVQGGLWGIKWILWEFLIKRPGWRIQKYGDFYWPKQSYPPDITQIYIQKGWARILILDCYIDEINAEIAALESTGDYNERNLKKAWNEVFFLVHWNRKKQI